MTLAPAASELGQEKQPQDPAKLEEALIQAIRKGDFSEISKQAAIATSRGTPEYIKVLLRRLPDTPARSYWCILSALLELGNQEGVETLADHALEGKDHAICRDLAAIVTFCKAEGKDEQVRRLLRHGKGDLRQPCLDYIVCSAKKEFIPLLIDVLEVEEKESRISDFVIRLNYGLRNLTGLDQSGAVAWRRWWEKDGSEFKCPDSPGSSSGTIAEFVRRSRTSQYEELRKRNKSLIYAGRTGHTDSKGIEFVLDQLGVPYMGGSTKQIVERNATAKNTMAILLSCCPEGPAGKKLIESIRSFVEDGGYFFANGLVTEQVVFAAFPGYLKAGGARYNEDLDIAPEKGSLSDPFLRHNFQSKFFARWKVVTDADSFQPANEKVAVLLSAPDLGAKKGTSAPVAGYFRYGKRGGAVFVLTCRFDMRGNDEADNTLKNLVLNFLIEAQENFRARSGK